MAIRNRRFGGTLFVLNATYSTKSEANRKARIMRERGGLARVVKGTGGWELYVSRLSMAERAV